MKSKNLQNAKKKVISLALVIVVMLSIAAPAALAAYSEWQPTEEQSDDIWLSFLTNPFVDVPDAPHWQNDPVSWAYYSGIARGVSATHFYPNRSITREMFVTFLFRWSGSQVIGTPPSFADSASISAWAVDAVNRAASNGVVQGFDDNTFRPHDIITREQMATILFRFAQNFGYHTSVSAGGERVINGFNDNHRVSNWANEAMIWATYYGIMEGANNNLMPRNNATRAQALAMLLRFVDLNV